jgi:hypothetical protein
LPKGSSLKQLNKRNWKKNIYILLITLLLFIFYTFFLPPIKSFIYQSMNKAFIKFAYGMAMPSDRIRAFIDEWNNEWLKE